MQLETCISLKCEDLCEVTEREIFDNDALNTFYLRLYGVDYGHIVKDHSDSEKGNLLPPHGLALID